MSLSEVLRNTQILRLGSSCLVPSLLLILFSPACILVWAVDSCPPDSYSRPPLVRPDPVGSERNRNSGLRHFLLLVIRSCISLFTCDSVDFPCFMLLFSLMYSGLLSVPGTYLSHSLVYKHLYSVARKPELRLLPLLLFLFHSSDSSSP